MAITKILQQFIDEIGLDLEHSVIQSLRLDFKRAKLTITIAHFTDPTDYNDEKNPIRGSEYTFNVSALPASVVTDALSLKSTVELEMIANLPEWENGVQVNDDGTPIV